MRHVGRISDCLGGQQDLRGVVIACHLSFIQKMKGLEIPGNDWSHNVATVVDDEGAKLTKGDEAGIVPVQETMQLEGSK